MDRNSADTLVGLSGAWHCHSQDAVLERCARPVVFDTVRKADPTFEAAIASFRIAAVLVLDLGLLLAAKSERAVLDQHLHILLIQVGKLDRKSTRLNSSH